MIMCLGTRMKSAGIEIIILGELPHDLHHAGIRRRELMILTSTIY